MNDKAQAIRSKFIAAVGAQEPPRDDTYDADKNIKIFNELDALQRKLKIETYLIIHDEQPVASILIRRTDAMCTAIVTKFVNGRRVMFKGSARYYGGATRALEGLTIGFGSEKIVIDDMGHSWGQQLVKRGFKAWRTL